MVVAIRAVVAVLLSWLAYRHAILWGRFFMNLHGFKSPAEVSIGYLRPLHRVVAFHLPSLILMIGAWLAWPIGHWGALVIVPTLWGFKAGMRCELLRNFVEQLLINLENGDSIVDAWSEADGTVRGITGVSSLNVTRHLPNPAPLVRYVVRTIRSKEYASDIWQRWVALADSKTDEGERQKSVVDEVLSEIPDHLIELWTRAKREGIPPERWPLDAELPWNVQFRWMAIFEPSIRDQSWWNHCMKTADELCR